MPRSNKIAPQKPAIVTQKPVTVPAVIVPKPSMLTVIKEGFGFGVGSAVAHRVMGSIFGTQVQAPQPPLRNIEYEQCLAEHTDFVDGTSYCAYLLNK